MTDLRPLNIDTEWVRVSTTAVDWASEDARDLVGWYEQVLLIRRFEEAILELANQGLVHGPAHASIGQEAGAVGALSVLGTKDRINGTHRAHHQILAKLLNSQTPDCYNPLSDQFSEEMGGTVTRLMAEIMGLKVGYCGGRGGSMHMRHEEAGIPGTSAIIGGNLPHAVGYALADKLLGTGRISVSFFGDGTLMAGAAYEAMNIAALYDLPVIFFLENNLYAVSTHVREQTRETRLSSRGPMLGIPAIEVDGMDVIAVRRAMQHARQRLSAGGGPVLVEALCYRFLHQSGGRPGSDFGYRSREEEATWRSRDPVATMAARLEEMELLTRKAAESLDAKVRSVITEAVESLTEQLPGSNQRSIPSALWPDAASVDDGIRGTLSELNGANFRELNEWPAHDLSAVKYIAAASDVLADAMDRDHRIVIMGEDVHRLRGGVSGATKAALERWPERVLSMPIAENGFVGVALGAALCGLHPVVEVMFGDFCLVAADQLFNQTAKIRHMFGGRFGVPMVLRVRVSPHTGYGSQHSGDPSGFFAQFPGWRIVAPTTPYDYVGLMNSALRCNDPVLVIEHVELFQTEGLVPANTLDFYIPFGRSKIVRSGDACTVVVSGSMVEKAREAAEFTGIDAEIIDLRTLDPTGLDWPAIEASVRRTNRVLVAEQGARGAAWGTHIVAELQGRVLDYLDHEILHVTGSLSAPVVSAPLNRAALAGSAEIAHAMSKLVANA